MARVLVHFIVVLVLLLAFPVQSTGSWSCFYTLDLSGSDPSSPHSWVGGENLGGPLTVATRPQTHRS